MAIKGKRTPGSVPHIAIMTWEQARALLEGFLKEQQARYEAFPQEHALLHMGGSDSVASHGEPTPITPGEEGDGGDPHGGFAPMDHTHDTTALGLINDLEEGVEEVNGLLSLPVHDVLLFSLLQAILFRLEQIEKDL